MSAAAATRHVWLITMRSLRRALCWLLLAGAGAGAASAPDGLLPSDASSSLMASPTEGTAPPIDTSALDFSAFLGRHDLTWAWRWDASSAYTLQPRAAALSRCGGDDGACCLAAGRDGGVSLTSTLSPLPLIPSSNSEKSLCGAGEPRCMRCHKRGSTLDADRQRPVSLRWQMSHGRRP